MEGGSTAEPSQEFDPKTRKRILLRHLPEGSFEIAVRMRTSVRYVGRTSRLRLWQLMKNRGFFLSFYDLSSVQCCHKA